jgi:hypothetical protein
MKMNLELAVTASCTDMGCRVKLIESGEVVETKYSDLVQDRIRIEPKQLVALDTSLHVPEIVWRWVRAKVVEVNVSSVGIKGVSGKVDFASRVAKLSLKMSIGDEVWFCKTDRDLEVHDLIVEEKPAHPDQIIEYIRPIIERVYSVPAQEQET